MRAPLASTYVNQEELEDGVGFLSNFTARLRAYLPSSVEDLYAFCLSTVRKIFCNVRSESTCIYCTSLLSTACNSPFDALQGSY